MSVVQGICQARRNGYKSTNATPKHVKALKRQMGQYSDADHYGKFYASLGEAKPSPKHANGSKSQFSERFDYFKLAKTLEATRDNGWFHFYVCRPDAIWWLLKLDIDLHGDRDDGTESDAWELMLLMAEQEFGSHFQNLWASPSRNGRGEYIYFMVANPVHLNGDQKMSVEDFRSKLNALNEHWKAKYNDKEHLWNGERRVFKATVDGVKGAPYLFDFNRLDRDDPQRFGTLATIPLTGIRAGDTDPDDGKELIEKFVAWLKDWKVKAFPPKFFFDQLPVEKQAFNLSPYIDSLVVDDRSCKGKGIRERKLSEAKAGDSLARMHFACSRYLNDHGSYPDNELKLCDYYEELGLASQSSRHQKRISRALQVLDHQKKTHDPSKVRFKAYNADDYLPMIQQHVRPEHFESLKYEEGLTPEDLSIGLYTISLNALTRNANPKKQFTCGNEAFTAMFQRLATEGVTERRCGQRSKAKAIRQVLQSAGLIVSLDGGKWVFGNGTGKSKTWGLGMNHARFNDFQTFQKTFKSVKASDEAEVKVDL